MVHKNTQFTEKHTTLQQKPGAVGRLLKQDVQAQVTLTQVLKTEHTTDTQSAV